MSRPAETPGGREGAAVELVEAAYANDPIEAEMIHGLLESSGIPSLLRPAGLVGPARGLAGLRPGYGGGTQRVMVPAARAEAARALLAETLAESEEGDWSEIANAQHLEAASGGKARGYGAAGAYARMYLVGFGAMAVAFGVFVLLRAV